MRGPARWLGRAHDPISCSGREARDPVAWWGLLSSASAPVLLIGGWTAAAARQPDAYDSLTDTISALAAHGAVDRWLMTTALVGVGGCHVVTALALRGAARPGRLVLGVGGVATILVAAFPLPAGDGGSVPHTLVAGISFAALAIWPATATRRASAAPTSPAAPVTSEQACAIPPACSDVNADARDGDVPWPLRPTTAVAASTVLVGLVGWFTVSLAAGVRVGLTERLAAGAQALWPLVTVLSARGSTRHSRD